MKVSQIYSIMNNVMGETLGKTDLVEENLENIVDLGKEIVDTDNVDSYVKKLVTLSVEFSSCCKACIAFPLGFNRDKLSVYVLFYLPFLRMNLFLLRCHHFHVSFLVY